MWPGKCCGKAGSRRHRERLTVVPYWQAKTALDALPIEWESGPGGQWASEKQIYDAAQALHDDSSGRVVRKSGDVASVTGDKVVEGVYSTPCSENAMMA